MAQKIKRQIISNNKCYLEGGIEIRLEEFNLNQLEGAGDNLREIADRITGTDNRQVMLMGRRGRGCILFSVQSRKDDALLEAMFQTLSDAAKYQLSKTRPGLLFAGLHGVSRRDLAELAHLESVPGKLPTALRVHASRFLDSESRRHVIGTCFASRGAITHMDNGASSESGAVYYFANDLSSLWRGEFGGLFK